MPRESKLVKRLREVRVFNSYEFYQNEPYIDRHTTNYRDVMPSHYAVVKRGENLGCHHLDMGSKTFAYRGRDGVKKAFLDAQLWASEKFGVKEWVRDPFGSYGDKEYIERRLIELLGDSK